jgi:hypothetical protein
MKRKILFITIGIILSLIALIIGLTIAGVNVCGALTSTTALLSYGAIVITGIFFIFKKITGSWK